MNQALSSITLRLVFLVAKNSMLLDLFKKNTTEQATGDDVSRDFGFSLGNYIISVNSNTLIVLL